MAEQYDVGSRITLDASQAHREAGRLTAEIGRLGAAIRGSQSLLSGFGTRLFAIGGAYLGFHAVGGAIRSASSFLYDFNAETTQTRIGLSSVFSAIEGLSFAQASKLSENVYAQLTDDAIQSVATTKELFDIYAGIVGPIRAAGFELDRVREITKDTVNASAALGVDFPQAKRDVAAMVRGAAGMDVKLFQTLRSMNLIKEDAKEFNALTQRSRIEKIAEALKKAGIGGEAFGKSLPGRVSTFVDVIQQLGKAFASPIFETFSDRLGQVNDWLIKHKASIASYLDYLGTKLSLQMEVVFERSVRGLTWVRDHWDEIVTKIHTVVAKMEEVAPKLAKALLAISIGREVVGRSLQATSIAMDLASRLMPASRGAAIAPAAATSAWEAATSFWPSGTSPIPGMALSSNAGSILGAGGAAEAGAGAAGIGGAAAGAVAFGVAAAVAGSVALAASGSWDETSSVLEELMTPLRRMGAALEKLGGGLWDLLKPILKLGGYLIGTTFITYLDTTASVFGFIADKLGALVDVFQPALDGLDEVVDYFGGQMLEKLRATQKEIHDTLFGAKALAFDIVNERDTRGRFANYGTIMPPQTGLPAPKKRPGPPVFDFRGSKFSIKQDFKDNDPDRVLRIFTEGLTKQAERRLQSPFRPAFTR